MAMAEDKHEEYIRQLNEATAEAKKLTAERKANRAALTQKETEEIIRDSMR